MVRGYPALQNGGLAELLEGSAPAETTRGSPSSRLRLRCTSSGGRPPSGQAQAEPRQPEAATAASRSAASKSGNSSAGLNVPFSRTSKKKRGIDLSRRSLGALPSVGRPAGLRIQLRYQLRPDPFL